MKEQKFLLTCDPETVNDWLARGWEIVSITPQSVSTGSSNILMGKFAIVIQREKKG